MMTRRSNNKSVAADILTAIAMKGVGFLKYEGRLV